MNMMRKNTLLLLCNFIIAIAMGIFAYETFRESKKVLSVIFATVSFVIFIFVIFSFVYNRKDN
ncbi:hypothetical protein K6959_02380 [Bacillus aquiflavi]|nr:hypothetical protein K6959_02380 [Bacillus aquiflavi]